MTNMYEVNVFYPLEHRSERYRYNYKHIAEYVFLTSCEADNVVILEDLETGETKKCVGVKVIDPITLAIIGEA